MLAGVRSDINTMQSSVTEFDVELVGGLNQSIISLEPQNTEFINPDTMPLKLPSSSDASSQK
jgi:hypothetical protein